VLAEINVARVPLSPAARKALAADGKLMETILTGGDDYEVVATVPYVKMSSFVAAARIAGVALTEIGVVKSGERARFLTLSGRELTFTRASFSHF